MIYDVKTKNMSFLKMSVILRNLGVKNNKFFLALNDPDLQGVDPRSKTLTAEQKVKIMVEISMNKWYFLREVIRIPVEGQDEGLRYALNLGNLSMSYLKSKNKNQIVILPRQHGKTVGEICDDEWTLNFATTNTNLIYLNKEFKDSKEGLRKYKMMRLLLPVWIRDILRHPNDKDNEEMKIVGSRNNTLKALPAANTIDQADKLGRGLTTALAYYDEFAFLKFNQTIYEAALPAWKTAAQNAKNSGVPYGITITTTPNNLDVPQGAFCKLMIDMAAPFYPKLFDYTDEELDEYVSANSGNDFLFVQYTYKELGRDEKWLQECVRQFNNNMLKVKREVLLEWPRSTDLSVFTESQLDKIFHCLKEPLFTLPINKYNFYFYEKIDFNRNYVLSCDVAGGISKDFSTMVIIDPADFHIVGVFKNNRIDTDNFTKLIETVMLDVLFQAIIIVERNSYGLAILDRLMKNPRIEPRMVSEIREQTAEKTMANGFIVKRKNKNFIYGVDTTSKSRRLMMEMLPEIVDTEYDKIISKFLYDEIAGLENKKNGKIEHSETSHDDVLMAYLIFRYAVYHGKCLRQKFGISSIPSQSNVKTKSSDEAIEKIFGIINNANQRDIVQSSSDSEMMAYLLDRRRKLNADGGTSNSQEEQLQQFLNVINLNKN